MTRPFLLLTALVLALALPLGACGKRGDLEPPEGEKHEYPRVYPPR